MSYIVLIHDDDSRSTVYLVYGPFDTEDEADTFQQDMWGAQVIELTVPEPA